MRSWWTSDRRAGWGPLPGARVVELDVLERRSDPMSGAALPIASDDPQLVLRCQEDCPSSLAAAALQDLGIHRRHRRSAARRELL